MSANLIFPIYWHNEIPHLEKTYRGKRLQIVFVFAQIYNNISLRMPFSDKVDTVIPK
jgi:hypothetical protein